MGELSRQDMEQVIHELDTYQTRLEMQNENLRLAQKELEESRRRYADLYDFSPVGYISLDPQGRIISVNLTGASMLGTAKRDMEQRPFMGFVAEEDRDAFTLYIRRTLLEEDRQTTELRLRKKDGAKVHVQLEGIPVRDDAGDGVEIRISITDISGRIRAEHKLQQKSSLLLAIIDSTDVMLVYLDPDFNFLWVNPAYARSCNMTPEELAGKNHFVLFPHRENEKIFRRVRDGGEPAFFKDKPFEFPDQPERGITYWDWSLVPVKDPAGRVTALVFSLRETTKYKQAELELAASEERFRRIAETSTDIIFHLDLGGGVVYVSPAVGTFGYTPDQVLGRPFSDFIPADDRVRAEEAFFQVSSGTNISLLELRVLKADGTVTVCEISATPVTREGVVAGIQGIARDITERKRTEDILRSNALQFKQFLDFTPIPVWIAHDPACRVITSNLAAARLLGVDPDLNVSQFAPEEERVLQFRIFRNGKELALEDMPLHYAVANGVRVDDAEIDIVPFNGNVRRMLGTSAPLYDAEGNVQGGIAAYMDITERKWMEEQLLRAKQEWEKTFDSVPDLITILDPQHRIVRVNRAMAEKMNMNPGQCIGSYCYHCVHDNSHPLDGCPNILTLRDGQQHMAEVYEERLGGDFLVTTTPIFDEQGGIQYTVHMARDITQVKETARLLQESEKRLNRAQRIAHLGSWELDTVHNVLTWSDEVFRIFGLEPQLFIPSYADFLNSVHPEDREMVHTIYMESLREGNADYEVEHRIVQKSTGNIRYVHEKCEHFRDETGKVVRSGGMVHDITERKAAEKEILILNKKLQESIRQLAVSNRELERSNQDLQQYAYIISHDLQEPLRTVSSFMQLLRRRYQGQLDAKADTFINFAVEATAHMQRLLTDLLLFSRVGGGELRLEKVPLETVLKKNLLHLRNAIEESGARIEYETLPVVLGDEMQLTNLLQNLISNALKFRGELSPRIHVSSKREDDEWIICVRDNGIGIDPQFAERIFLIFQRLHRRDDYSGTGIGLAICKKVVERHGGRIWVESALGRGAAFYFSLPAWEERGE